MRSNDLDHICFLRKHVRLAATVAVAVAVAASGCVSQSRVKLEPSSTAKRLGLSGCSVSVPMTQPEVLDFVKRWDSHPNPEQAPDWLELTSKAQAGDEIRMISCKTGDPYFYALIRSNKIISRFHPVFVD